MHSTHAVRKVDLHHMAVSGGSLFLNHLEGYSDTSLWAYIYGIKTA